MDPCTTSFDELFIETLIFVFKNMTTGYLERIFDGTGIIYHREKGMFVCYFIILNKIQH